MVYINFMAVTLFSLFASAANDMNYNYESLEKLYDNGKQAQFSEIKGWRSGRCYKKTNPKVPLAFVLIAIEIKGAHGTPIKHMSIVSHFADNLTANRYDRISEKDREELDAFMHSSEFLSSEVSERDNAIYSNLDKGVQAIKKSGDIYVGILRHSLEKDYDYNCYFFKKVL